MSDHWESVRRIWNKIELPMRPHGLAGATMRDLVGQQADRVLLLGVTPEYAALGKTLIALDRSSDMIRAIWPGDCAGRKAVRGDWMNMPFTAGEFDVALGDGVLNAISFPQDVTKVLAELARVLDHDGYAAIRMFCPPDKPEDAAAIRESGLGGHGVNIYALKLRVLFLVARTGGKVNILGGDAPVVFDEIFPDRAALARANNWDMSEFDWVDGARGSTQVFSFHTRAETAALANDYFGQVEWVESGSYTLSDSCPIMVLRAPKPA